MYRSRIRGIPLEETRQIENKKEGLFSWLLFNIEPESLASAIRQEKEIID